LQLYSLFFPILTSRIVYLSSSNSGLTIGSNNSLPPLMVTMIPFGYMAPQSKGMCILQTYIEFLH
jgi:membrane-bound metal-dependent hydrolase YbcI (DUF457 family)